MREVERRKRLLAHPKASVKIRICITSLQWMKEKIKLTQRKIPLLSRYLLSRFKRKRKSQYKVLLTLEGL